MTITHAAEDDTRAIERDFQKSVKKLMSNNELEESIDGVEEVTYIGNRTEQTYSFTTSPIGTESINRVGDEDGVASIIEAQVVREDSGGRSSYTALAVCVSVGAAFVLIIAFLVQKKLRQGTEHEVDFEVCRPGPFFPSSDSQMATYEQPPCYYLSASRMPCPLLARTM